MDREPPGDPDDLAPDALGGRWRIVQDDRRGHHHVEGLIAKRQPFASAKEQADILLTGEIMACCSQLGGTEVDPDERDVETPTELEEQLAVAAPDFENRAWPIPGHPLGDPLSAKAARRLAFLFPKKIIASAERPVAARIGV
jgi:hypothetical protein